MKTHRFIGNFDISGDNVCITDGEFVNQVRNVLKIKPGETVILCDGKGMQAEAELISCGRDAIELLVLNRRKNGAETGKMTVLYLAMLKKDNFEVAVQKAVECGVSEIVPILTERTIKTGMNAERIRKIIREAAEQSGRGILPVLSEDMTLKEAAATAAARDSENMILDPSGEHVMEIIKKDGVGERDIGIFIGPEGGFTENELRMAEDAGFKKISLGKTILRAETAAAVGVYLASNLMMGER